MRFFTKFAALQLSALAETSKRLRPLHRGARRIDPKTPLSNLVAANERSGGRYGQLGRLIARLPHFFETMRADFSHSESLGFQDLVFATLFPDRLNAGGYFIEIGVGDGRAHSNTWLFEKTYQWSGLLIEPNPKFHAPIRASRSAALETIAAYDRHDVLEFVDDDKLSGFAVERDYQRHQARGDKPMLRLETAPAEELLDKHAVPSEVDFLSVDTEGSERQILRALDFSKRRYRFICVEHNFDRAREADYRSILEPHGYRPLLTNASIIDAFFVHDAYWPELDGRMHDD